MSRVKKLIGGSAGVTMAWFLGVVIIWEIAATVVGNTKRTPDNILPHVYQIIASIFDPKPVSNNQSAIQIVLVNAQATLVRALIGLLWGAALGFLLALIMKLSGIVEKLIFPYLMLIQMIPILGMAPIVLALTQDINSSRIIIAAILTFYPVATNTLAGFNSVAKEKYELMYSYAANKRTIYQKVLIPTSIPYFFTGLKIAAPMAVTASILVDTLQGDGGLGAMLSQSLKGAMSIYVFWQIVLLSAGVGILSCSLMGVIENMVSPQKRMSRMQKRSEMIQRKKGALV